MVNIDKVYLMTKAAAFEKKEINNALNIVSYRRKDYILLHMLLTMLSVSLAYLIIVGAVLFMIVMAFEEIILNVNEMILILIAIVLGYMVVLILYYMISHKYFGEKHVKARQNVRQYVAILKALQDLENAEGKEAAPDEANAEA